MLLIFYFQRILSDSNSRYVPRYNEISSYVITNVPNSSLVSLEDVLSSSSRNLSLLLKVAVRELSISVHIKMNDANKVI